MKKAIIYYSLSGNTEKAAKDLASLTGADLIKVDFVKPMPKSKGAQILKGGMQTSFGMKPAITGLTDTSKYDELILGAPIWAGKCASPINTILATNGIADKITSVFTFSGGGDNDKCIANLNKRLPNLKHNVALADKSNELSKDNDSKIKAFAEQISNG